MHFNSPAQPLHQAIEITNGDYGSLLEYTLRLASGTPPPKYIITNGGYAFLRQKAIEIAIIAIHNELNITKMPQILIGSPAQEILVYDKQEGRGYIQEYLREELIKKSQNRTQVNAKVLETKALVVESICKSKHTVIYLKASAVDLMEIYNNADVQAEINKSKQDDPHNELLSVHVASLITRTGKDQTFALTPIAKEHIESTIKFLEAPILKFLIGGGLRMSKNLHTIFDTETAMLYWKKKMEEVPSSKPREDNSGIVGLDKWSKKAQKCSAANIMFHVQLNCNRESYIRWSKILGSKLHRESKFRGKKPEFEQNKRYSVDMVRANKIFGLAVSILDHNSYVY